MLFSDYHKSIITILSGMFGGLGRALTIPTLDISVFRSIEVCFYAALSATMGYLIKCFLDRISAYIRNFRKRKNRRK